jgi:hypothetical protein
LAALKAVWMVYSRADSLDWWVVMKADKKGRKRVVWRVGEMGVN